MAVRLDKAWLALDERTIADLGGHLGVYELGRDDGVVVFIGYAGGRSAFGLRGELAAKARTPPAGASRFRCEVNQMYHSRYRELLAVHLHDHGRLPVGNIDVDPNSLGRLRPD